MKEEELQRLIGKYYSGTSTDEEERFLRAFFVANTASPGYEAEKDLFGLYLEEGEIPEPSAGFEGRIIGALDNEGKGRISAKIRRIIVPLLSAAAGFLILTGTYFFFTHRSNRQDTYSDPKIAYAETVRILTEVSARMNKGTEPLKAVGKINEMKAKSMESINRSATLVEKNLKSLGYLRKSTEADSSSKDKVNN